MIDVDLAIVGGGPAGLSTALHVHAAAPATRMIVLEAERYPRDKICAGGIGARGLRVLERLGVAVDCPRVPIDAIALRLGGDTIVTREPGLAVVVRRIEFDHALARAALARGIDVRDGMAVEAIELGDDAAVLGIAGGERVRARAIVGADGVGGIVRRATGFPRGELRAQVVELDTPGAPGDAPRDTIVFDLTARDLRGYAWDFPTVVAGEPLMCRGAYVLHHLGADSPRERVAAYLAARGVATGGKLKQFAERGYEPGAPIARPRVLLVGEAAGIDIATGEGIAQALEYGALAGPYLARALAADDLRFASWRGHVARHHVGWQLRLRHVAYRMFYGAHRDALERMMPRLTGLFRVAIQDFAGVPMSKLAIARGAGQLLAAIVHERARD
ncbi:MAG TPA: NAD(P)/FAD-dependent oxidoreductase [Kofleriaceae bacterium]|nr:NAD(P)/FAD-dependent oxidoreductase [Kofleriaceae bacterium]